MSGIVYDVYERRSKVPAMLAELAVPIEACRLAVGDYAIGRNVLVERKCVADLHQSIVRGRFWPQIGRLRIVALAPYLLVEGPDLDAGPLLPTAVRGCLVAAMDLGVHVIRSSEERDSAQWLHRILVRHGVRRPHLEKPAYARRSPPSPAQASAAVLAAIPGISFATARALLEHFGSLRAVLAADPSDWVRVRGVGPVRAEALAVALSANCA